VSCRRCASAWPSTGSRAERPCHSFALSRAGNSGSANAINHSLKRKTALASYLRSLDDGRYPIDDKPIENATRPIALGRKNWLFAGSGTVSKRAAAIMRLLDRWRAAASR
jgi:hypothetical protein